MKLTRHLLPGKTWNPGDKIEVALEESISSLGFNVHKFNNRPKPGKKRTLIIPVFAEFGSEILIPLYVIPKLLAAKFAGCYVIVIGWYGREYLYRHLVDEFWELKEEHQWLREYCRAFHHASKNLKRLEKVCGEYGRQVTHSQIGNMFVCHECFNCGRNFAGIKDTHKQCPYCKCETYHPSIFSDVEHNKKSVVWIPQPSPEKLAYADKYIKPNSVGITARARKCYGRNLPPEFYKKLINRLRNMGYHPIWLGEKQTTLPCPVKDVVDLTRMDESRDLETTLAIVSRLKFTVQFWTASTRLAGLMGVPYIIFESPDQIWGKGQEGMRLFLCTKNQGKLIAAHYLRVLENPDKALDILANSIEEVENGNFETVIGMVSWDKYTERLMNANKARIGI